MSLTRNQCCYRLQHLKLMALPQLQDGIVISVKVNHSVLLRKTVTPKPEYTRLHLPPVSTTLALLPVIQSSICLDPTL